MRSQLLLRTTMLALLLVAATTRVQAGDGYCDDCGCSDCCKVCRLVCEDKKVEITCWGCKCEDFCLPGPGKPDCRHCEMVCESCEECDPEGVYAKPKKFVWKEWIPGCAKMYTKKKLMKKTITKKVPSYKWVVEDLCAQCESEKPVAEVEAGAYVPPVPDVPGAKVISGRAAVSGPIEDPQY